MIPKIKTKINKNQHTNTPKPHFGGKVDRFPLNPDTKYKSVPQMNLNNEYTVAGALLQILGDSESCCEPESYERSMKYSNQEIFKHIQHLIEILQRDGHPQEFLKQYQPIQKVISPMFASQTSRDLYSRVLYDILS